MSHPRADTSLFSALLLHVVITCAVCGAQEIDCVDYRDFIEWRSRLSTGGFSTGVSISDAIAYHCDNNLTAIDITDPVSPAQIGSLSIPVTRVAVSGDYAYAACRDSSLRVVDISDPSSMIVVATLALPGDVASRVEIAGSYAYVINGYAGLRIIDISTPQAPVLVGTVNTPYRASGLAVSGNHICVTDHEWEWGEILHVIDITDPASPDVVGSVTIPGAAFDVAVDAHYAYVAAYYSGLQVVDISDPATPLVVGSVDMAGRATVLTLDGQRAYVSTRWSVDVVDISIPTAPRVIGNIGTGGEPCEMFVEDELIYVADGYSGLSIRVILDEMMAPILAGSFDAPDKPRDIILHGDLGYVASYGEGILVLDVTDAPSPEIVGNAPVYLPEKIETSGDHLYSISDRSLTMFDISDHGLPVQTGPSLYISSECTDMAVSGNLVFITVGDEGLKVIDTTEVIPMTVIGSVDTWGHANGISITGDIACIADGSSGLVIVEISDPTAPAIIDRPYAIDFATDVVIDDDLAYVAHRTGLSVADIGDPSATILVAYIDIVGGARQIAIHGSLLYLSSLEYLSVVDVTDPQAPVLLGTMETGYVSNGVCVVDDLIYLPTDCCGIRFAYPHCDRPSPIYITSFEAQAEADLVQMTWQASANTDPGEFRLVGHHGGAEWEVPYQVIGPFRHEAFDEIGHLTENEDVTYILYYRDPGQAWDQLGSRVVSLETPPSTRISDIRPNPFNLQTTIEFDVSEARDLMIAVYDLVGRRVARLADRPYAAGSHEVTWHGRDEAGRQLPAGTYLIRLEGGGTEVSRKFTLMR